MMKILLKIICTVVILMGLFMGVLYWHMQEQKAWSKWKQQGLAIVDVVTDKEKEGWSKDAAAMYGYMYADSIDRKEPLICPYCFVKALIK
jgi:hypothetical protein